MHRLSRISAMVPGGVRVMERAWELCFSPGPSLIRDPLVSELLADAATP
jgi:hypothetical protein